MKIPILKLNLSEKEIQQYQEGIATILRSGFLTMGEVTSAFEDEFSHWNESLYSIATNSGTSSLEIPLRCLDVRGKVVLCPSNTFMATPIAVIHAGARVQFVDCVVDNLQISYEHLKFILENNNTDNIAALIVVHIAGIISPDFWEIKKLCDSYNIQIIEDAAHAHGALLDNKKAGNLAFAGSFSFYPTKVLFSGEGGMITTSNKECFDKSVVLREHGKADHRFNIHTEFGYNWRISEFNSLLGLMQVKKADSNLRDRRKLASHYDELLDSVSGISKLNIPQNVNSSYYKYVCYLDSKINREKLKELLIDYNISLTGEVYSTPCHSQPVFDNYPETLIRQPDDFFKNTDYISKNHICLPLYPGLTNEEIQYVVDSLKIVISKF